jgi:alginate O-acetyltransferase complex protein AlgI
MNGYWPQNLIAIAEISLVLTVELLIGFAITRLSSVKWARLLGWSLVIAATIAVERLAKAEPAGLRMLALIGALLWGMKVLVSVEEHAAGRTRLKPRNWFHFSLGWPGMRPSTFAEVFGAPKRRWAELINQGLKNLSAGLLLILMAWWISSANIGAASSSIHLWIISIILLPGLSLLLHFGLFNVLAGFWRGVGAETHALFRNPLKSTSLSEFWGRRWNLAFSEMTALVVFRPLRNVVGPRMATMTAFLFSGLLHELAISVPAQAGYGLPFLYFLLHALAMQIEHALSKRGIRIDAVPWRGRLWTIAWLIIPLPMLFHRPFLEGCVWPLIGFTKPV